MRVRVLDRYDRRWRVRRRWSPWRRRVRDVPDVPVDVSLGDDPISAIIGLFLLVLAIPAIVVLIVLVAELALLLTLLPLVVLLRLVLPVPWTIELWSRPGARRILGWHLEHEVPVRGWRASEERMRALATEITSTRDRAWVPEGRTGPRRPPVDDDGAGTAAGDPSTRRPGDAAPPATPGAEVATGSAAAARHRTAGGTDEPIDPFAQRGERRRR